MTVDLTPTSGIIPVGSLVNLTFTFMTGGIASNPSQVAVKVASPQTQTLTQYAYPATITQLGVGIYFISVNCNEAGTWKVRAYCPGGVGQSSNDFEFSVGDSTLYP